MVAALLSILRRISYFILGIMLGAVAMIFCASNADAVEYSPNGTSGLNLAYNGNDDDNFYTVNLPWSINFLGTNYSSVYVGTNGYITLQSGNGTYSGFSPSNPAGPHISIYPADRRLYKLYYAQIAAGTAQARFVIRAEGVDYSNAAVTYIWEVHFYPGSSYFDIYFVDAPSSGNAGTAGISNGSSYVLTYATTELTGIRINANGTLDVGAPVYSSSITTTQQARKNSETTQRTSQSGNEIHIDQIGDNNSITIRQGVTITGKNRIELYSNGNYNTLNLNQGYTTTGVVSVGDSNNHYLNLNLIGSNNTVTKQQTGTSNFLETTISGNNNNVTNLQQGTSGKILFQSVSGNSNTVTTNQKDSGQHYLDLKLTGNGHNVGVTQQGSGNHAATIDFTNSGGASSLNLNQSGTSNQIYSIQQSCTNPAGCSTTVTQP
jgi:hypothetical protein